MQDISMIEVSSSTGTTPRDYGSVSRSDASPSDPSNEDTATGSDMTGSLSYDSDDDF